MLKIALVTWVCLLEQLMGVWVCAFVCEGSGIVYIWIIFVTDLINYGFFLAAVHLL